MTEDLLHFCGNCGAPNTDNKKFCSSCGANLLKAPASVSESSAQSSPPKPGTIEIERECASLRRKIAQKQAKLDDANSIIGPLILAIIGILTVIWFIGIVFLLAAGIWYEIRYEARPKLRTEIASFEAQLRELERH